MLILDGSTGEGGGQVLRTALALSLLTSTPFRMTNIRAGRSRPGLLRQHLTAVRAATEISCARVTGDEPGSRELEFAPGTVKAGDYQFAVGTAGSATLVLQTILPALLVADGRSQVSIEGGTHNPAAPPFEFLEGTFAPMLRRMGANIELRIEAYGFYPAGGGRIVAELGRGEKLSPLELLTRGKLLDTRATALVAHLPIHIAQRELHCFLEQVLWNHSAGKAVRLENSPGPGNVLQAQVQTEALTETFTAFGEKGVSAETVANHLGYEVRRYLHADVPVGAHLADQLLLPLAMAGQGQFRTLRLSSHATTQLQTIRAFMDTNWEVVDDGFDACRVTLGG